MAKEAPRMPIESGCPDPIQYMHPTMRRNYGEWAYHDRPRPGVLHHTSKHNEEIWTVRAGTQKNYVTFLMSSVTVICDLPFVQTLNLWLLKRNKLNL